VRRGLHRGQGVARLLGQHLAGRGQRHRAAAPLEQDDAQAALQPLDRLRQRRLGDAKPGGGSAEVQFVGHRQKLRQFPCLQRPVHAVRLSIVMT